MLLEPYFSQPVSLRNNDRFLLCSDGLTDMLWDAEIAGILSERTRPAQQAARLLEEALDSGGKDNITVIVVHVKVL